jgi:TolB-like protein/Flp pilus assembly protein TadD
MGRELGVDYVVEGSLRVTGSQLQVNAQLIDADNGAHIWADRFETDGSDMAAVEGEITGRLLWDLRRNLFAAASRRAARDTRSDGDAKTIAIRGWSVFHRPRSEANMQEALQLWERALDLDPASMSAKIGIALGLTSNFWYGWSRSFEQDEARAERLLLEVFAVDPSDVTARIAMGILRRLQGRLAESKIELESVPALDRDVAGLRQLGATLVYLGQPEAAIRPLERSIRISPYEANIGFNYTYLGLCHLLLGRAEKAIDHLRMARTSNPRIYIVHLYLAAALGLNGDFDEARVTLAEGIRLKPEVDSLEAWCTYRPWETNPQYMALRAKTLDVGLRQAEFPIGPTLHEAHLPAVSLIVGSRAQAPRLSIVVLPFNNLSDDPEQQYFADGVTDDLTTDLSRIENAFVISRNTAFAYRNKPVDAKQIGRELGVRYLLEGSVRRSGDQIRVNVQLIGTETAAHIWAERFDRTAGDLLALQDEITSRIAVSLDLELIAAEARRPTEHPDARDYIFRGYAVASKPPTRASYAEAVRLFECALAFDAGSAEAQGALADVLVGRVLDEMTDTAAVDIGRAEDFIERALASSPRSSIAHYAKGNILRYRGYYEAAIPEYETVIELNRNEAGAYANLGWCKLLTGSLRETVPALEQALRLSPRDTRAGNWSGRIGLVHLLQSRIDEAIFWLEKGRSASPALPFVYIWLAAAYALKGAIDRAQLELADARRLRGEGFYASIARLRAEWDYGAPQLRPLLEATFFAGLRKAGMPEE